MATRKSNSTQSALDKFHVGQRVILVLSSATGWQDRNGEEGVVTKARRNGSWYCTNSKTSVTGYVDGLRYAVRYRGGESNFSEDMLRAACDGDEHSTWEAFTKATGIDLAKVATASMSDRNCKNAGFEIRGTIKKRVTK